MGSPAPRDRRVDIQYLRAVAVGTVVLFHLWPTVLPGGYVGVDVFFVISGFLITGQLLAEAEESGRIRLGRFWARRIRRLLPAAITVIVATLAASWLLLPREALRAVAEQAIGSALYVENWLLAIAAVDYLDAENAPTPYQHFWSLSVEEQFYLAWPLLILAAMIAVRLVARRRGRKDSPGQNLAAAGVVLAAVTVLSLTASILLTHSSPEAAYFGTHVRAWEFGVGGLVAWAMRRGLGERLPARLRKPLWWTGVAALLAAALLYGSDTPFPGSAALLPVLATALTLAARPPGPLASLGSAPAVPAARSAGRVARGAVERIGEWSYSIYLWHWPAVVIALALVDGPIGLGLGLAMLAGILVVSAASERWIERPFRTARAFAATRMALPIALVGSLLGVGPAAVAIGALDAQYAAEQAGLEEQLGELGANAGEGDASAETVAPFPPPRGPELYPSLSSRKEDTRGQYGCYVGQGSPYEPCGYGDEGAALRIAIIGDSHASSLVPALVPIVEEHGWRLDVMVGNGCDLTPGPTCVAGAAMLEAIENGDYDVVLATRIRSSQADTAETVARWRGLLLRGLAIVPIVDVPSFPEDTDRCLGLAIDAYGAEECWTSSAAAGADGPDSYGAAGQHLGLPVIDLTDVFCREGRCPAVIGNVIVYRDSPASHITATFSRTLSSALAEQLVPIVEALGTGASPRSPAGPAE